MPSMPRCKPGWAKKETIAAGFWIGRVNQWVAVVQVVVDVSPIEKSCMLSRSRRFVLGIRAIAEFRAVFAIEAERILRNCRGQPFARPKIHIVEQVSPALLSGPHSVAVEQGKGRPGAPEGPAECQAPPKTKGRCLRLASLDLRSDHMALPATGLNVRLDLAQIHARPAERTGFRVRA